MTHGQRVYAGYSVDPPMIEKAKQRGVFTYELLLFSGREYGVVRANRMAAALAYRTFFSLAPLLFVAVSIFGGILGSDEEAQREILDAIEQIAGEEVAMAISTFIGSTFEGTGTAAIIGGILLLWTASSLFLEMQHDLNDIFGVPYEHTAGAIAFVKKRGIGFLWALGLGLALTAVWLLNLIWRFVGGLFPEGLEDLHTIIGYLTPLVSAVVLPLLFGLLFQTMTAVKIRWRAIWLGSIFTAVVFLLAAYGIGLYFNWNDETSAYTVAGSVFVVLLMAFVLAGVFLFGAQVTKVYSDFLENGDVLQPSQRTSHGEATGSTPDAPVDPLRKAALFGFLGGLFVGWRRTRK